MCGFAYVCMPVCIAVVFLNRETLKRSKFNLRITLMAFYLFVFAFFLKFKCSRFNIVQIKYLKKSLSKQTSIQIFSFFFVQNICNITKLFSIFEFLSESYVYYKLSLLWIIDWTSTNIIPLVQLYEKTFFW